ncbi:MAG: CubicO group peptidase (beta-lactamase class C family) [Flammeovirgaceae bacterium]|jgi:CubicO group peptidase (beta-lactamase class C family)
MKAIKTIIWVALFLVISFVGFLLYETQDEINATSENMDEVLQKLHNQKKMVGFAVSVFDSEKVIYENAFGFADRENQISYDINTQQYIASISKTTIGIALMKAEELGLLKVEDGINQHLPFEINNPKFPNNEITLFQLVTHTSSLEYNEKVVESLYVADSAKNKSLAQFVNNYFQDGGYGEVTFSEYAPGENWSYSNIGAGLVAYVIEHKSGMPFSEFTKKYIFEPLEMENTFWFESDADSTKHSGYYEPQDKSVSKVSTSGVQLYPC